MKIFDLNWCWDQNKKKIYKIYCKKLKNYKWSFAENNNSILKPGIQKSSKDKQKHSIYKPFHFNQISRIKKLYIL